MNGQYTCTLSSDLTCRPTILPQMKTELASQSGFSMPEKYFQVRREEGADNKHYSKIGTFYKCSRKCNDAPDESLTFLTSALVCRRDRLG